jgi:hypothetical protein
MARIWEQVFEKEYGSLFLTVFRLPDNWTPLPYGTCTSQTTTPNFVQAVGYAPIGTTCSFQFWGASQLPVVHQQGYLIAASTDLYEGFHYPDGMYCYCIFCSF